MHLLTCLFESTNQTLRVLLPRLLSEVVTGGLSVSQHHAVARPHLSLEVLPCHLLDRRAYWKRVSPTQLQLTVQHVIGDLNQ